MGAITSMTRAGVAWIPKFVRAIDQGKCIGCGRCFKVCGRGVLLLQGINEDGEFVDAEEDEIERKVMTIAQGENCIGCEACAKVCPKACYTHEAISAG
jgi:Nif-specific ferredoxin III